MGKASRKKQSSTQAGNRENRQDDKPESGQEGRRAGEQADKRTSRHAGKLAQRQSIHVLILIVIGLLAYSNTFNGPFQWDEADYLIKNPFIKSLDYFLEPSRGAGLLDDALVSRYVGYLTFALNYQFHGFDVVGYHVVNLAIHLVNAVLVYFLILLTFRTPYFNSQRSAVSDQQSINPPIPPLAKGGKGGFESVDYSPLTTHYSPLTTHYSLLTTHYSLLTTHYSLLTASYSLFTIHYSQIMAVAVALLFVAHPVQTEAVTYVFQRFTSLVGMFYLASIVFYVKARLASEQANKPASLQADKLVSREAGKLTDIGDTPLSPPLPRGEVKGGAVHSSRFTIIWYVLSLLSAILAMKTKENAFTLPVMITLYEFLFFSGPLKSRMLRLTPFLLTLLIVPLTIIITESGHASGEIISQIKDPAPLGYRQLSRGEYLFTQFRVIITYIRLLFLPVDQNIYYTYPVYRSFFDLPVILSFLFLLSLFGSAVYLIYRSRQAGRLSSGQAGKLTSLQAIEPASRQADSDTPLNPPRGKGEVTPLSPPLAREEVKGGVFHSSRFHDNSPFINHYSRLLAFGILWFFITLSVESSIIPIPMVINEYRVYLPSVGFFLALVAGIALLLNRSTRFASYVSHIAKVAAAAFAVIVLVLASATYARNTLWKDKVTLWEDVVSKSPDLPRGYNNLGLAFQEKGEYQKAIEIYERCISKFPTYEIAYVNLGVTYAISGRTSAAIENFRNAVALNPGNITSLINLARAYTETRQFDEALLAYARVLALKPNDPETIINRGIVHAKKGDMGNASADFQKACALGNRRGCEFLMRPEFR